MPTATYFTFLALAILVLQAAALMAQTRGGATLVGTVKDSSGAVVAGAKIKVVNMETSFVTETSALTDGGYYVPYLIPGNYRITVSASGFKEFVRVKASR
jgi:Carboxypeptidase regulatory-like domain